jgi:hypothetical protein
MLQNQIVAAAKENVAYHTAMVGDINESIKGGALTDADRLQAGFVVNSRGGWTAEPCLVCRVALEFTICSRWQQMSHQRARQEEQTDAIA